QGSDVQPLPAASTFQSSESVRIPSTLLLMIVRSSSNRRQVSAIIYIKVQVSSEGLDYPGSLLKGCVDSVLRPPPHGSGGAASGLGSANVSRYSVAMVAQSGSSGCHHHSR